jgi:hypothetical protein
LQGRQLAPYVHTGAGRTSPIAILVNAILAGLNGLQLPAPAALLGDLANMIDVSLTKASGVLFDAPWMEASGFRSLNGVLGAVGGLCKALTHSYIGPTLGTCHPGRRLARPCSRPLAVCWEGRQKSWNEAHWQPLGMGQKDCRAPMQ